jgi:hypothetical protein
MEKNTKIFILIGILVLIIICIIISLIIYFNRDDSDASNTPIAPDSTKNISYGQPINKKTDVKTTTPTYIENKPLNVNISTDNPNIIKTYNTNAENTNININQNVNKQQEIDKKKILNNTDNVNSAVGQNYVQSSVSNLP